MQYNNWKVDLLNSISAIEKIKDTVLAKLISGNIISIEKYNDEILLLFDKYSGIDLLRQNENGLQGIASRVQFGNAWDTFTIRFSRKTGTKTEYEKRIYQIKNEYFYPTFTLQAYFDNRNDLNLLSIAVIKTTDLYSIIETSNKVQTRTSDNVFKFIKWDDIDKDKIKIYRK